MELGGRVTLEQQARLVNLGLLVPLVNRETLVQVILVPQVLSATLATLVDKETLGPAAQEPQDHLVPKVTKVIRMDHQVKLVQQAQQAIQDKLVPLAHRGALAQQG